MFEEIENNQENNNEFRYKIEKNIGIISTNTQGWTKEVNLISYNDKEALIDIRRWSPNKKMTKGITFKKEELDKLIELLETIKKEENKGEDNGYIN